MFDETLDALREDKGFSAAGPGDDFTGTVYMADCLGLGRIAADRPAFRRARRGDLYSFILPDVQLLLS